tara:strand:+ start:5578 stop:6627 length:1050 start_codon:yes stop_codon:yes gene_type:complete
MNKNILITGGCGFIGSEAVRILVNKGYKVYNFDKLSYASCNESLSDLPNEMYNFFHGDIYNKKSISEYIKNVEPLFILNFAAESHVDRSIDGPDEFINTNIVGTFNILDASLKYFSTLSSDAKNFFKFVHISTDEVYGSLKSDANPFTEENNYNPNSPYSASKASSDFLVRAWGKTYGLPINITHSSNNYGPWQFPEKLIPLTVKNALSEKSIQIYGDGSNIRDWIHVTDNVEAIIQVMLNGRSGETYNIGAENELSNLEIVNLICDTLDRLKPKRDKKYSNLIKFVKDRPGHDMRYAININKIKSSLSWSPKISFNQGIEDSIKWMITNKNWLLSKSNQEGRIGLSKD